MIPILKRYAILCSVAALVLAYIHPIFFSPWFVFFHEISIVIALLLMAIVVVLLSPRWQCARLILILLIVACLPLLQWLTGVLFFSGDATLVSAYGLAVLLAVACGQQVVFSKQRKNTFGLFVWAFFFLGLCQVWFALNQFYGIATLKNVLLYTDHRPFGNLRQPNNFASVLVLCFFAGWFLFEKTVLSRAVFYLWVLFITMGLVLAQSRTTLLVGLLTFFAFVSFKARLPWRTRYGDLLWVLVCYVGLWFLLPAVKQYLAGSLGQTVVLRELVTTEYARLAIWYESLLAIWQGPLWGYGWNQIGVSQVLLENTLEKNIFFQHSHNLFLDLLLYNGPIIGGAMVLGIIGLAVKACRDCRSVEGWFILAMIGAIFTHAMLEFPLHYAYFLIPVAFLLGMMDVNENKPTWRLHFPSWYLLPVVLAGAILVGLLWRDYRIIHKEHFALNIELTGMFPRQPETERTDDILLLTHRREHLRFGRAEVTENMSAQQIEWMRQVSHRFASPYYLSKYAKACQLNGCYDEANRMVKVIKRLFGEAMYQNAKLYIYEGVDND